MTTVLRLVPSPGPDPTLAILPAQARHHANLCQVLVNAFRQYREVLPTTRFVGYMADVLDVETELAGGQVLVAERQGQLVGAVTLATGGIASGRDWPPGWVCVRSLAVIPEARGYGVGAALFEEAVARARLRGASALGAHLLGSMTAARDLVESFGLRRAPAFDRVAVDPRDDGLAGPAAAGPALRLEAYLLRLR